MQVSNSKKKQESEFKFLLSVTECCFLSAGIGDTYLVEFTPLTTYERVMQVNYFGTIRVCQQMLPLIRKRKGRIINVGSFLGHVTTDEQTCNMHLQIQQFQHAKNMTNKKTRVV